MVFFPNHKLELWEYHETSELDSYLEPKKEYCLTGTVDCDFQSMSPNESLKEFGEIRADTYKIYIDQNVSVTDTMVLRLQNETPTYEITGTVINNNHLPVVNHKKIIVRKHRKPVPLNEVVVVDDD